MAPCESWGVIDGHARRSELASDTGSVHFQGTEELVAG